MSAYHPTFKKQLTSAPTAAYDCGVMSVRHAIDYATTGAIKSSRTTIRDLMGKPQPVGTNMSDWLRAVEKTKVPQGALPLKAVRKRLLWDEVESRLKTGQPVLAGVDYAKHRAVCSSSVVGSTTFTGLHALFLENMKKGDDGQWRVRVYDPLCDGRYKGCPQGAVKIKPKHLADSMREYEKALGNHDDLLTVVLVRELVWEDEPPPPSPSPEDICIDRVEELRAKLAEWMNERLDLGDYETAESMRRELIGELDVHSLASMLGAAEEGSAGMSVE